MVRSSWKIIIVKKYSPENKLMDRHIKKDAVDGKFEYLNVSFNA